jgi:hypothetical protein
MENENRLDLIDRNALLAEYDRVHIGPPGGARKLMEEAPTVDAVEVVHARWIPLEYDGYASGNPVWDLWECSECQEEHSGDEDTLTPYCPHCGALMDGGNEDG